MNIPRRLSAKLEKRKSDNSLRTLYNKKALIDFSSNDYLGFAKNINIANKVALSMNNEEYKNGSSSSRLISGNHDLHVEVESMLSRFFNTPATLLFNSGYDANLGIFSCVPQNGDVVLYDEYCHASIRDGLRLSNAKSIKFKHNDLKDLEKKYRNTKNANGNTYLVVESIYSMDGDQSPLEVLARFCDKNGIYLIVDEAHSTGIYGKNNNGLINQLELEPYIFARIHTFGKAFGCHGAVVAGSSELIDFLINYARSFIYTTAIPIHAVLTIKYTLKELVLTDEVKKLKRNIKIFKDEIECHKMDIRFINSDSPIQCLVISDNKLIRSLAEKIRHENFDVKAILPPSVPEGKQRLRFSIHSYNTKKQIQEIFKLLSTFA